jgi:hypothetical protein
MSLDNGLLVKKTGNDFELYYLSAGGENKNLIAISSDIFDIIGKIVVEQKSGLEYGTTFIGF